MFVCLFVVSIPYRNVINKLPKDMLEELVGEFQSLIGT